MSTETRKPRNQAIHDQLRASFHNYFRALESGDELNIRQYGDWLTIMSNMAVQRFSYTREEIFAIRLEVAQESGFDLDKRPFAERAAEAYQARVEAEGAWQDILLEGHHATPRKTQADVIEIAKRGKVFTDGA